jgi:ribonuclease BN (tRNA processing enzyme)
MMKITVMGSASGMAVPHRNPSAYLVETKHGFYIIDAGDGVARQLVQYKVDVEQILAVFISHTHADHAAGLMGLIQYFHLAGRKKTLDIFLPSGVLPGFETLFPYFHIFQEKWPYRFHLRPIMPGQVIEKSDFRLWAIPNDHLKGNQPYAKKVGIDCDSYSFRFSESEDRPVLYTADIDSLDHVTSELKGIDVLISECTHVPVEAIIHAAMTAGIPRIILTHIPPELDGRDLKVYDAPEWMDLTFASDGLNIEV